MITEAELDKALDVEWLYSGDRTTTALVLEAPVRIDPGWNVPELPVPFSYPASLRLL